MTDGAVARGISRKLRARVIGEPRHDQCTFLQLLVRGLGIRENPHAIQLATGVAAAWAWSEFARRLAEKPGARRERIALAREAVKFAREADALYRGLLAALPKHQAEQPMAVSLAELFATDPKPKPEVDYRETHHWEQVPSVQ